MRAKFWHQLCVGKVTKILRVFQTHQLLSACMIETNTRYNARFQGCRLRHNLIAPAGNVVAVVPTPVVVLDSKPTTAISFTEQVVRRGRPVGNQLQGCGEAPPPPAAVTSSSSVHRVRGPAPDDADFLSARIPRITWHRRAIFQWPEAGTTVVAAARAMLKTKYIHPRTDGPSCLDGGNHCGQ